MPRNDDRETSSASRPGPYESSYQVLRGYDAPPPVHVRATDGVPVMVARRPDPVRRA